jgi:hypothetical protein
MLAVFNVALRARSILIHIWIKLRCCCFFKLNTSSFFSNDGLGYSFFQRKKLPGLACVCCESKRLRRFDLKCRPAKITRRKVMQQQKQQQQQQLEVHFARLRRSAASATNMSSLSRDACTRSIKAQPFFPILCESSKRRVIRKLEIIFPSPLTAGFIMASALWNEG